MARHQRFICRATHITKQADPNCTFAVGAIIVLGSRIISTGACTTKTHPANPKIKASTKRDQLCAEIVAALKSTKILSRAQIKNCRVYIARKRKDGTVAMAKPCKHCTKFLKELGIRAVFYTNNIGQIESVRL